MKAYYHKHPDGTIHVKKVKSTAEEDRGERVHKHPRPFYQKCGGGRRILRKKTGKD